MSHPPLIGSLKTLCREPYSPPAGFSSNWGDRKVVSHNQPQ
jgi:hypothetical protein